MLFRSILRNRATVPPAMADIQNYFHGISKIGVIAAPVAVATPLTVLPAAIIGAELLTFSALKSIPWVLLEYLTLVKSDCILTRGLPLFP
jgi:hypothetical protein